MPVLERVTIAVFAGNHGIAARQVSAYPQSVTAQMVANFAAGGAAINQLAKLAGAELRVVPMDLDRPTADFTDAPAMSLDEFLHAFDVGYRTVPSDSDLVVLGEMGIANTTAASALCAALLGGDASVLDRSRNRRRRRRIGPQTHCRRSCCAQARRKLSRSVGDRRGLGRARTRGHRGRNAGGTRSYDPYAARRVCCDRSCRTTRQSDPAILDHCRAGHVSAEFGHRRLLHDLNLRPLLDLGMRLGEASGAAIAILLLRASLACHGGMAISASGRLRPRRMRPTRKPRPSGRFENNP